ncbi:MAG TPA: inorganic triphosphatase, partial [Rhizomicrobium sp.]|nr:inorganic triphosphatase [Rhizomicrobium sp.]
MVQEIEVKLEAPPGTVSALAREPWLRRLAVSPLKKERLVSVYYDTDRFDLRDKGIAFRLRHADGKIFQSVKRGAVLSRQEWEWEIDGGKPDFGKARQDGSPLKSLPVKKRDLKPVFETDVKRRVLPVRYRDSEIEIAFDRGEVKTGRRHVPISEIELELKGGKAAGLIELAGRIAAKAHASYGALPKAARGYALKKGGPDQPVWADPLYLDPGLDAEGCFKTVALSCLSHFAANEKAVLAGEAEGVHQMRVGLRRLRTALSLFKALLRGGELENIKTELKWLTEEL